MRWSITSPGMIMHQSYVLCPVYIALYSPSRPRHRQILNDLTFWIFLLFDFEF